MGNTIRILVLDKIRLTFVPQYFCFSQIPFVWFALQPKFAAVEEDIGESAKVGKMAGPMGFGAGVLMGVKIVERWDYFANADWVSFVFGYHFSSPRR